MVCLSITCSRGSGFFFQAEDGIRDHCVTGVQTCALPISRARWHAAAGQGRDAVRPGARASRAGRAARADLSQSGRVTRKAKEAPAPKERIVKVADWAAERGDAVIVTLGLGSCVAIMLHDANAGAGAMAHILLPSKSLARDVTNLAKFPETA